MSTRSSEAYLRGNRVRLSLALLAVGLAAWVYYPITGNYFFFDDFLHLYDIVNLGLIEFVTQPHGGHMLLTNNAIFWLFHRIFGPEPTYFFWIVLLTHLLNVALLFSVIQRLTGSVALACLGAAAWGSAQVQDGTLGWYSTCGQVLVGTCLFAVLAGLARVGQGHPTARWAPAWWGALLLVASTSFGIGIGVALVLPVAAWLLLPAAPGRLRILLWLAGSAALVPPLYSAVLWLHFNVFDNDSSLLPMMIAGLGPTRVILDLTFNLIGIGIVSLLSGMVYGPRLYPAPIGYALVALYIAVLAAALVRGPQPSRRQILACLLLTIGCYGIVGGGRGMFLTEASRLDVIRSERYQYVGTGMLSLALCIALARLGGWRRLRPAVSMGLVVAWFGITLVLHARLTHPIVHHTYARRETERVVAALRQHIAAAPPGADVYIDNQLFLAVDLRLVPLEVFPGWAGVFVIFFPDNVVDGRRVFFVWGNVESLPIARRGRRATTLLVGPDAVPGGGGDGRTAPAVR